MKAPLSLVYPRMDTYTIFILTLATFCFAQDTLVPLTLGTATAKSSKTKTEDTTSSKTSSASAQTHTVIVGKGDHKFRPEVILAENGDIIEFNFFPPNHSVVRAEYTYPCIPYEMTGKGKVGFFSGFKPVDAVLDDPPKYRLKINDSDPIFFYCSAPGSCTDWGMVGVINPNATTPLGTQRDLALNASYSLNPGEPFPAEAPSPSPSSPNPTSTFPSSDASSASHNSVSGGAIAGIVVGGQVVIALAALLFFFIGRSKTLKEEMWRKSSTIRHTTPPSPSGMFQNCHHHPSGPNVPPSYYAATSPQYEDNVRDFASASTVSGSSSRTPTPMPGRGGGGGGAAPAVDRAGSHCSVRRGTFDISTVTGHYTRTHEGEDTYKYTSPPSRDAASPNWDSKDSSNFVPLGPYGRQVSGHGVEGNLASGSESQPAELDG